MVLVLISLSTLAQQTGLDSLLRKFDRYRIALPQEKIYVHVAQELFITGETLWFKAYYVDGAQHHPMNVSKVAYVEILDLENRPILQTKIGLKNGEGHGSFFLPASINSGHYQLRAYTQWMKNFSPDFFFHKKISIVNSFRKLEKPQVNAGKSFNIQFFPEGGNLVNGLKSKVAFQGTNKQGKGIRFSGWILDEKNDTIAAVSPFKFGIGNFFFTPLSGNSYRAVLTDTLGNRQTVLLPSPQSSGYVMEVRDSTSESLAIHVTSNTPSNQSSPYFYYVVHSRQIISSAGIQFAGKGRNVIVVPKKQMTEGISHITIFDSNLQPVCERLFFKPTNKRLSIDIQTTQKDYGVRRKVIVDIMSKGVTPGDKTALSLSVIKADSLQQNTEGNIFNYLWLESDLKGEIESPAYYLETGNHDVATALDNLMLTHGWRRFAWKDVLGEKSSKPVFIPEYRGHIISGTLSDERGNPVRGIPMYLSTPGKNIQLYTALSGANGNVQFEMKDFLGSKKIIVQTNSEKDSTKSIKIRNPYSDVFSNRTLPAFDLPPTISKNLLTRSIAMQVQDIYYGEDSLKFSTTSIDSTAFYGKADETYFLDDYTRFPVMEEVMREYIPGVMVRKRKDGFHFLVIDHVRKGLFQEDPLVLLDGTPIFDIDKIMAFDPVKVKKLEVMTSKYFLGPLVFSGIVSYTTYTGDLAGFQLHPTAVSLNYEGLQRQREFYSPVYENEKQRNSRMPDRRNLLFWAPQITLNEQGKHQLEFFTSDLTGDYKIVVEGITRNGYSGSAETTFTVKQFNN
jgi:hypothetical protein